MQFWALIVDSFRESLDRKIFWVLIAITLIIVAVLASVSFGENHVSFLLGLWEVESDHYSPASDDGRSHIIGLAVYMLTFALLGWAGVILMIIATAGMVPRMMEHGAIDVLLSKPISRPRLFLLKYLAGLVFVFLQATIFVTLVFLVMGLRWGVWVPGYLLSIPLLVVLFSYIYCVSVLVAVKTRSTPAAILLSLAAWFVFASPTNALQLFETFPAFKEQTRLYQSMHVLRWVFPKTAEIPYFAARWSTAGTSIDMFPESVMETGNPTDWEQIQRARELEEQELEKDPWTSIGSSLVFESVIVFWAMVSFTRKDY